MARIVDGPELGLTRDQVEVADSDPRWQLVFDTLATELAIDRMINILEPVGYIYRRDEGAHGGQLFVVDEEGKPGHRIAYIHVVTTDDPQWSRYLGFRDLLRSNPAARAEYELLKRRLAAEFPNDRNRYTAAKDSFIESLLAAG